MVAIIDYDAGNIKSVEKAIAFLGKEAVITRNPSEILAADQVILPGVGSFGDAMEKLHSYKLVPVIKEVVERQIPFLGICLGLQLLFEKSEESPGIDGLGILPGLIRRFPNMEGLKIPHIGWNSLEFKGNGRLFQDISEGTYVYFVHSYYLEAEEAEIITAVSEYGVTIHASIEQGNVFACQFHPEKSSETGLKMLDNFLKIRREDR
ncbi:MAG: imidazole glycerol phosphate synthase subunit HisH [Lachnospiraceae bacterium]|nr:imidazole glycerol phosphate synthase subunit HisH [Lachnospiraceae bacterium]